MQKHAFISTARFGLFLLLLAFTGSVFSCAANSVQHPAVDADNAYQKSCFTVVLDAGHGGEDGGAVSLSGLYEKDLNLSVAKKLKALFEANGIAVVMTRESDVLLYDKNADYHGRKKAMDLAARREIGESTEHAIFVSIHMNAYPIDRYRGLQVWYSQNDPRSETLAKSIQGMVAAALQPDNTRTVKAANSSIYLLHHLTIPAVLIECGFLSNPDEADLLAQEDYQNELALAIFLAIMEAQCAA